MANVLNEEKKQQVLALGRLGWSLRQIQQATRIRRETASAYLKAAGIAVRLLGDAAAVSAMLDRLLHHGHVLKCGPRNWRTKTDLPPQEAAG
jgi:streptomycin 6-kinase